MIAKSIVAQKIRQDRTYKMTIYVWTTIAARLLGILLFRSGDIELNPGPTGRFEGILRLVCVAISAGFYFRSDAELTDDT